MTAADFLAQVEARADAATEGPWGVASDADTYLKPTDVVGPGEPGERFIICEYAGQDAEFIAHARADVPRLVAALRAVLDLHKPGVGASQGYLPGGDYGYVEPYCEGCVHSDEYAQQWPCQTARAVATALGVNPS